MPNRVMCQTGLRPLQNLRIFVMVTVFNEKRQKNTGETITKHAVSHKNRYMRFGTLI